MRAMTAISAASIAALATALGAAALELAGTEAGLAAHVEIRLDTSGVTHPVTAVLLNFRSYDTWLELAVLLAAALGALQGRVTPQPASTALARDSVPVMAVAVIVPLMVLMAGYLLASGAHAPGGAFQAGAVLAAAAVLLQLCGRRTLALLSAPALHALFVLGVGAFTVTAAVTLLAEGAMLSYPPALAGPLIVLLETAAMVSIAAALAALVAGQVGTTDR